MFFASFRARVRPAASRRAEPRASSSGRRPGRPPALPRARRAHPPALGRFASRAGLAVALVATGCGAQTVRMDPPEADEATVPVCADLVGALPDTLLGAERAQVRPESALTAAWGDPAIGLRCGVPRPVTLAPDSLLQEVNGVAWLPQPEDAPTLYTAVGHEAYVELSVPPAHGAPAAALSTVSDLVTEHVPALPGDAL